MLFAKKITILIIYTVLLSSNAFGYIWSKPEKVEVLSNQDKELYETIFSYQKQGKIKEADDLLNQVQNDILKPYVMYDRFQSDSYKCSTDELNEWLEENNESCFSSKVAKLISSKNGKVSVPINRIPEFKTSYDGNNEMIRSSYNNLSSKQQKYIKKQIASFKKAINSGNTKSAKNILQDKKFYSYMNKNDLDRMAGVLTFSYFLDNEYELAREIGQNSAENGEYNSAWALGLIDFKERKFVDASKKFIKVYENDAISSYQKAQGAYWASKSLEEINDSDADKYLKLSCDIPYTFYGSIACEKLGKFKSIKWEEFDFTVPEIKNVLQNYPKGEACLALLQIGQKNYAVPELIGIAKKYHEQDSMLIGSIIGLTQKLNMPNTSIQLSKSFKEKDLHQYHSAAYPIPGYSSDNWKMDKAFVYAIAKQESLFNEGAKSGVGARGLMQIMPATAAYVAGDLGLKKNKDLLYDPEYNLSLGQEYMSYLLEKEHKDPNLIKVLVSYNAGPGNYRKWEKRVICYDDPLLFIESIPSKETRNYVKNVLLNLWFYRSRFNQDNPSLSNLSEDQWPLYHHLDD